MGVLGLELVLGRLVGSHDHGLGVEEDGDADDVAHALVQLGQAQVAVVVDVDGAPVLGALDGVFFAGAVGELFLELLPDLVGLHLNFLYKI